MKIITKRTAVAIIVALLIIATTIAVSSSTNDKPAFNHDSCQYPTRTTNPIDGCDNTDPCDVMSAVKGGSGDCEWVTHSTR